MKKILIIDDDEATRAIYRIVIENRRPGFRVIESDSAEDGLRRIDEDKPAIIILDNRMPDMTGYLMIYRLFKEKIPHGKIIFMSGSMDELLAARAIALGATIAKGKHEIDLPLAIDEVLAA